MIGTRRKYMGVPGSEPVQTEDQHSSLQRIRNAKNIKKSIDCGKNQNRYSNNEKYGDMQVKEFSVTFRSTKVKQRQHSIIIRSPRTG
jgi:hypothetical protein